MSRSDSSPRSLVFLHIPKCGGTSLTQTLRHAYPEDGVFTDEGNLTRELLLHHLPRLDGRTFFHGHAGRGVLPLIEGRATLMTVLRCPEDQVISNYLHLRREPALGHHGAALSLDFATFLRRHWHFAAFQAVSLGVACTTRPVLTKHDFFRELPAIREFLTRIDLVGCLDRIDDLLERLAEIPPKRPRRIRRLNAARDHGGTCTPVHALRARYRELRHDPELAGLIAAEEAIYDLARTLAARPRSLPAPASGLPARARRLFRRA